MIPGNTINHLNLFHSKRPGTIGTYNPVTVQISLMGQMSYTPPDIPYSMTQIPDNEVRFKTVKSNLPFEILYSYLREDYGFPPAVCRSLADDFQELTYLYYGGKRDPGAIIYNAASSDAAAGTPLTEMKKVPVSLTVFDADDAHTISSEGPEQLIKTRIIPYWDKDIFGQKTGVGETLAILKDPAVHLMGPLLNSTFLNPFSKSLYISANREPCMGLTSSEMNQIKWFLIIVIAWAVLLYVYILVDRETFLLIGIGMCIFGFLLIPLLFFKEHVYQTLNRPRQRRKYP